MYEQTKHTSHASVIYRFLRMFVAGLDHLVRSDSEEEEEEEEEEEIPILPMNTLDTRSKSKKSGISETKF